MKPVVAILSAVPLALLSAVPADASAVNGLQPLSRESVDGRVTTVVRDAATGSPVPGVTVHAISADQRFGDLWSPRGGSDADGVVTFESLLPGQYSFFVTPENGMHGMQWLGATRGTGDRDTALVVTAPAPDEELTLPDIRLDPAGSITGRLINGATGEPVSAQVAVASMDPLWRETTPSVFGNGQYTFSGLGPYGWKLFFMPAGTGGPTSEVATQWSGGVADRHRAHRIQVFPGQTSVADQRLRPGTVVTGNATRGPDQPPAGPVYVFHAQTHEIMAVDDILNSDRYSVRLLPGQRVKLCSGRSWCYADGASLDEATTVPIGRRPLVVDFPGSPPRPAAAVTG
jgi:hypothetical protein